jgi:flavin reductase (DIM6/NTAB) family NADH-FMN oxidoreductase RutF
MKTINVYKLSTLPLQILEKRWALVVAGDKKPNPMTVAWGGFGTLWQKPVVTIYVRPTRFTHKLLMNRDEFTLNILPASFRKALNICGTMSGRDCDKWERSGLAPKRSSRIAVPGVKEAELIFECRTLARLQLTKKDFLDNSIEEFYPEKDYHTVFIGEVLRIYGDEKIYEIKP